MEAEQRLAELEAKVKRLERQIEGHRQALGEIQGVQIPLWEHLLLLCRWAYSHCKSHGHSLRLNDFLIAGNAIKAQLQDLEAEG